MTNLQPVRITSVSPEDLSELGFDTRLITQDQFDRLASKMSDNYVEHYFWHDLECIADLMNLSRI